jgi:hypothetical protein
MKIIEKIVNVNLNTEEIVERPATAKEEAGMLAAQNDTKDLIANDKSKKAARKSLLEKLGITADEAALIGL